MILFLLVLLILTDHFLFVFLTTFSPFCLFRARLLVFFFFFIPEYILAHHLFGQSHSLSQIQLSRLVPFTFLLSSSLIFPTVKCSLSLSFTSLLVESFTMNWISLSHSSISLRYSKLDLKVTAISPRAVEDPHNAFCKLDKVTPLHEI